MVVGCNETLVGKFVVLSRATDFKCHGGDEGWKAGTRAKVIAHIPGDSRVIAEAGRASRSLRIADIEVDPDQAEVDEVQRLPHPSQLLAHLDTSETEQGGFQWP